MTVLFRVSTAFLAGFLVLGITADVCAAVPARFRYQARLVDTVGQPLAGPHTLTLGVWQGGTAGAANSGTKLYEETATVTADGGVVSASVGAGAATFGSLTPAAFQSAGGADLFVQVAVDGAANVVLPRTRLDSVPFALASAGGDARMPIDPTSATLPIVIDKPGSYYLTGDVTGTPAPAGNEAAIVITATEGVTLDLNGFGIRGPGTSASARGIYSDSGNVTVRNGLLSGWGTAIELNGSRYVVADVTVNGGLRRGIQMVGTGAVSRCLVSSLDTNGVTGNPNFVVGIRAGTGSSVSDCVVRTLYGRSGSETNGIVVQTGSSVSGCVVSDLSLNGGNLSGIQAVGKCRVSGCSVSGLVGGPGVAVIGIWIFNGDTSQIDHCTVTGNESGANSFFSGIAGSGLRVSDCLVAGNGGLTPGSTGILALGFNLGSDCQVINCSAVNHSRAGSVTNGAGIGTGDRCVVRGCDASSNRARDPDSFGAPSGYGIRVGKNSLVEGCFCANNSSQTTSTTSGIGIILGDGSIASGNRLSGNQNTGILVNSTLTPAYAGRNIFRETTTATLASGAALVAGSGAEANVEF